MSKTAWSKVKLARDPKRPTSQLVIQSLFSEFIELHGDRLYKDDPAMVCGIGFFEHEPVTIIAQEKGVDTEEKIKRNFGMPHPEGYRKALRLMKQAEKFNRPIITIIDTPGAYPGIGAEERGQARAIALNLQEMMSLTVPIIVVVLSEGGSGGALAIGVGDEVLMFENSIYSILSPEGFASILYKDSNLAEQAAEIMKITAADLYDLKVIDKVIYEGEGLHIDQETGIRHLRQEIARALNKFKKLSKEELLNNRYQKYRKMGAFIEKEMAS